MRCSGPSSKTRIIALARPSRWPPRFWFWSGIPGVLLKARAESSLGGGDGASVQVQITGEDQQVLASLAARFDAGGVRSLERGRERWWRRRSSLNWWSTSIANVQRTWA